MYIGLLHVKYRLFPSGFKETWIFWADFRKKFQTSNFMKIRPLGAELFHADRQTDMTKLTVASINAPTKRKNGPMIKVNNNEFERVWLEMPNTFFEVQNWHVTGGTRENHKQRQNGPEQKSGAIQIQTNCWVLLCRSIEDSALQQAVRRWKMLGRGRVEDEMWINLSSVAFVPNSYRVTIDVWLHNRGQVCTCSVRYCPILIGT
jgi:hypothetical protein